MKGTIYTIGYSGFSINEFVEALKQNKISAVIDVRSFPFSTRFPDYNKDVIENILLDNNIYYRNYAHEFGARQEDLKYYSDEGYLDFEIFSESKQFLQGVSKLCKSMQQGYVFALMCAEKKPIECHRAILVARKFYDLGYNVVHLLPNNQMILQKDIDEELVKKYFPDYNQMTLFYEFKSKDSILKDAYRMKNKEIGYVKEDLQ